MLRCSRKGNLAARRILQRNSQTATENKNWHGVLGVRKNASLKEITTTYYELAKEHHPDHGGDQAIFLKIHKAYRELRKVTLDVDDIYDCELSTRPVPADAVQLMGSKDDPYWIGKKKKIKDLLGEQKFATKGKGDPWSGFLYRVREAPHMTDGFSEFYCLYLHGAHYSHKMGETVLEVVDFMVDKTYYIHMNEKLASKYDYSFDDDDDDFVLISLDGIYKQIYIGRDIPVNFEKFSLSTQPLIEEIQEDFTYYLE